MCIRDRSQTSSRREAECSPIPPVNTSASRPPIAAAYAPIYFLASYRCISLASLARRFPSAAAFRLSLIHISKVNAISPVAAGDTALAGFLAALSRGDKTEEAVRFAAACGTASVTKEGTARISPEDGRKVLPLVSFPRKI